MAADPIAAAEQLAGSTYASAQDRTAAGKKALLDNLGAQGTYTNALVAKDQAAAAPTPAAVHPGDNAYPALTALSYAGAQQQQVANQAALAAAAHLAATQAAGQQQAAGTYFDQVGAAIPIEQSRAASDAAQTMAQLLSDREQRANALQLQHLQLQETQARINATKATAANGGLNPAQVEAASSDYRQKAVDDALPAKYDIVDEHGNILGLDHRGQAISDIINSGLTPEQAAAKNGITTPAYVQEIAQQAQRYYDSLDAQGYYRINGGTKPQIAVAAPQGWDLSNPNGMLAGLNASAGNLLGK